jgi:hypothetical protein
MVRTSTGTSKMKRQPSFSFKRHQSYNRQSASDNKSNLKVNMNEQILRLAKDMQYDKLFGLLIEESIVTKKKLCDLEMSNKDANLTAAEKNLSASVSNGLLSHTILHEILVFRPPFDVVDALCSVLSEQSKMTLTLFGSNTPHRSPEVIEDSRCQTPLHVAVRSGCDVTVAKRLMKGDFMAKPTIAVDDEGRTPVHWACENHKGQCLGSNDSYRETRGLVSQFRKGNEKKRIQNMVKIVKVLLKESPQAVRLFDHSSETPVDIARRFRADPEIILELLNASHHVNTAIVEDSEDKTKDTNTTTGTKSKETHVTSTNPRTIALLRRVRSERSLRRSAVCDTNLTKSFRTLNTLSENNQGHGLISPIDLVIECRTRSRRTRTVVIDDCSSTESKDFGYLDCMRFM